MAISPKVDIIKKIYSSYFKENIVTIIANDCWGGQFYKHFDLPYSTPFVGLYLYAPCYIDFVSNFSFHLGSKDIKQIYKSKYIEANEYRSLKNLTYPIGLLDNKIEIHFLHYKNWNDAIEKWELRKSRVNFENLAFKFDGSKDLATPELVRDFSSLNFFRKIVLMQGNNDEIDGIRVFLKNWQLDGAKMYNVSLRHFDIFKWMKTGEVKNNIQNLLWNKFFVEKK